MNKVIFFSGLPKAGKSVTLHALFRNLIAAGMGREFFLERVHPDQEGNWTVESPNGGDRARSIKNVLKANGTFWNQAFVEHACSSVAGLAKTFPVVLADMGGIPSPQNREIISAARSAGAAIEAVILYPVGTDPQVWEDFWASEGVTPTLMASQFGVEPFEAERSRLALAAQCFLGLGCDASHGPSHVEKVRKEAKGLAEKYAPEDVDLVDEAARLHDIGNAIDRDLHEEIGAEVVANEPHLQQKWGDRLNLLVEAIREHRASSGNPTSEVARIISDADRMGSENPLRRAVEYRTEQGVSLEGALLAAAEHTFEKYGPGGRGTRTYFPETKKYIKCSRKPIIKAYENRDLSALADIAGVEIES